jgi:hypothetical protein
MKNNMYETVESKQKTLIPQEEEQFGLLPLEK